MREAIGEVGGLGFGVSADSSEFAGIEVFGSIKGLDWLIGIKVVWVVFPSIASSEVFRY